MKKNKQQQQQKKLWSQRTNFWYKAEYFLPEIRNEEDCPLSSCLFNVIQPSQPLNHEKENASRLKRRNKIGFFVDREILGNLQNY